MTESRPVLAIEPNFTPENNVEPDGVPVGIVAGERGRVLGFPGGARVPLRSREYEAARRREMRAATNLMNVEDESEDVQRVAKTALGRARSATAKAKAKMLDMYGLAEQQDGGFVVIESRYPAILNTWRDLAAAINPPLESAA